MAGARRPAPQRSLNRSPGSVLSEVGSDDHFERRLCRPPPLRAIVREQAVVDGAQAAKGIRWEGSSGHAPSSGRSLFPHDNGMRCLTALAD